MNFSGEVGEEGGKVKLPILCMVISHSPTGETHRLIPPLPMAKGLDRDAHQGPDTSPVELRPSLFFGQS